jgi:phosphosulfolactate phosphohydrolase-like enzyme
VKPGKYLIHAQSPNPFEPTEKNQKAWKSAPLNIFVASKRKVTVVVEPVSRGAEYVGPWRLKEMP